jgi:hypothetical protein
MNLIVYQHSLFYVYTVVVKSLQQLCSETSILTDPALFPEEAQGSAAPPAYNQRPKPEKTWQFG